MVSMERQAQDGLDLLVTREAFNLFTKVSISGTRASLSLTR